MPSSEYPHWAQEILNVFSSIVLQAFIITFLIIKKSPSPVPNKGNNIHTRSVELYVHIFKARVVGSTRIEKDDLFYTVPRTMREAGMLILFDSRYSTWAHEPSSKLFCKD